MSEQSPARKATVLVYSDDRQVRQQVRLALGRRVASDLPEIEIVECATQPAVIKATDAGGIDLCILDGEAAPAGGFGVGYQMRDEVPDCPPIMLLVARVQDAWLGTWSRADKIVPFPVDPQTLPVAAAELLRARLATEASAQ